MVHSLRALLGVVAASSAVAAGLLAVCRRVAPERGDFGRRFTYFFLRSFVTVGFWAAIVWWFLESRSPGSAGP